MFFSFGSVVCVVASYRVCPNLAETQGGVNSFLNYFEHIFQPAKNRRNRQENAGQTAGNKDLTQVFPDSITRKAAFLTTDGHGFNAETQRTRSFAEINHNLLGSCRSQTIAESWAVGGKFGGICRAATKFASEAGTLRLGHFLAHE